MSGNPGKSASIIQILAVGLIAGSIWLSFSERTRQLEKRIEVLEADSKALAPLSQVMRGFQPERGTPNAYEAVQATGPVNVPQAGIDSALAWCPANEDQGPAWIELVYPGPVATSEIRIHASYNPGAVTRVLGGTADGDLRELWTGTSPTEPLQIIPISQPAELSRIRLELDTAKVPGWNEIDAVALIGADGLPVWATAATASSTWSKPPAH